ncbi:phospholipase D-like domain-containing protein [Amycolatopsis kentuckyensis]|uniref:phospholipase D-like domain-containing protein n=1 Tax=Amycolatopsis kentuckyensis TaxID=218823 RepID=UPI000A384AEE|nr:phospholipase D-like domain-containing protein [Amycolatopsis kentuckyensis]
MAPKFKALTVAVGALLALAGSGVAHAASTPVAADAPGMEAIFNNPPENGDRDHSIETRLVQLANATPAGAEIHISLFSWTRPALAEAIKAAQARGVKVRIALDGAADDDPANTAMPILKSAGLTQLVFCGTGGIDTGCIAHDGSPHSINHDKLWMFSETEGKKDVVVIGSYNLTTVQGNMFNNALLTHGDPDLYGFYLGHMQKMLAQKKNNNYFDDAGYHKTLTTMVTSYLSPRADSKGGTSEEFATDTWAQLLKYITKYEAGCSLNVVQANIADSRTPVVTELVRIAKLGCKVRIVYDDLGTAALAALKGKANVTLKKFNTTANDREITVHSKYMLYTGNYSEKAGRQLVFTGSHNISGAALRDNDEILIKVENAGISAAYQDNFSTILARAKCSAPATC